MPAGFLSLLREHLMIIDVISITHKECGNDAIPDIVSISILLKTIHFLEIKYFVN